MQVRERSVRQPLEALQALGFEGDP
jgi:hypothetical protein